VSPKRARSAGRVVGRRRVCRMLGLNRLLTSRSNRGSFDALCSRRSIAARSFSAKALHHRLHVCHRSVILPLFVIFFNCPSCSRRSSSSSRWAPSGMAASARCSPRFVQHAPARGAAAGAAAPDRDSGLIGRREVSRPARWMDANLRMANWFGLLVAFDLVMLGASFPGVRFHRED